MSAAWMVLKRSSATPTPSTLIRWGWKRASGASKRSPPTLITLPSGSCGGERMDGKNKGKGEKKRKQGSWRSENDKRDVDKNGGWEDLNFYSICIVYIVVYAYRICMSAYHLCWRHSQVVLFPSVQAPKYYSSTTTSWQYTHSIPFHTIHNCGDETHLSRSWFNQGI